MTHLKQNTVAVHVARSVAEHLEPAAKAMGLKLSARDDLVHVSKLEPFGRTQGALIVAWDSNAVHVTANKTATQPVLDLLARLPR